MFYCTDRSQIAGIMYTYTKLNSTISSGPGHVEGELNLSKRSIRDNNKSSNNKQLLIQQQDAAESQL